MIDRTDAAYMEMAYGLAEKAVGRASPNPCVGAVIVRGGRIVGHGHHAAAGEPHAEIVALRRAGARAKGATLYVTLEPCVHWGRTPPCADAVLTAGFRRIVISALDPNPLVFGKGARRLRRAGLDVAVGLLAERNRRLNEAPTKYLTRGIPFVTLKAAVSLDGRMATRSRDARWISSAATRDYVHLLRAEHDALLVGIGTVLADDPRLTVRHALWPRKALTRVVLDANLRLPLRARLLSTLDRGPVLVFARAGARDGKRDALLRKGAEIITIPGRGPDLDLARVLARLGERGIASILIEGGGRVATSILEARLADKAFFTLSPLLIGGREAVSVFGGEGAAKVKDAFALRSVSAFRIGPDTVLEGYF
jgi:diaminohydroxyphosphoribosylaminopyrimidine deaminase / 5-amino-6-(5-phosphoribosylamino)uracil reductase